LDRDEATRRDRGGTDLDAETDLCGSVDLHEGREEVGGSEAGWYEAVSKSTTVTTPPGPTATFDAARNCSVLVATAPSIAAVTAWPVKAKG
jgi:hypothetical protein